MTGSKSAPSKTVLLVDDQVEEWINLLSIELEECGFKVAAEAIPSRAVQSIKELNPDVVLLDIMFPDKTGRLVNLGKPTLAEIKKQIPAMPVVMFTTRLADADLEVGPDDYLGADYMFAKEMLSTRTAGFNPFHELSVQLDLAISKTVGSESLEEQLGFIVGSTKSMQHIADSIVRVSATESTVLITGESGTGKELVARAIHRLGSRSKGPFVAMNCGGLTDETLESRLFGHEKGAFTGANRETKGFFGEAEGGSLFLDEVEAMPIRFQEMLLRVLQEKTLTKMGASQELPANVRIIAATNRDLMQAVEKNSFRLDLLQRLSVFEIALPPLRDRLADLPALFAHVVEKKNQELKMRVLPVLRDDVRTLLASHDWPGNIRELENAIHSAMVNTRANILTPGVFDITKAVERERDGTAITASLVDDILHQRRGWETLQHVRGPMREQVLRELIVRLKERHGKRPSASELAKVLHMSSANLRRVLSEAGISLRKY